MDKAPPLLPTPDQNRTDYAEPSGTLGGTGLVLSLIGPAVILLLVLVQPG